MFSVSVKTFQQSVMAEQPTRSPVRRALKKMNMGKKRKVNYSEWKQVKNERLMDGGLAYTGSKGVIKPARQPPNQVSVKTLLM